MQYIGQHKGYDARFVVVVGIIVLALIGGIFALSQVDIPASKQPVSKTLDAKTLLETK